MDFTPGMNICITGSLKKMEMLERGNCVVTVSSSAEGQMRDIRIRFFDVSKVLLYRVRDRIQVKCHIQNRRIVQGDRRTYRAELIGDEVTLVQRRLSAAMSSDINPQEMMSQQADMNWGLLVGTVVNIFAPNDKATVLSLMIPRGDREQRCTVSCLGRFKPIADQIKEGDKLAVTFYISVREADENHGFSQNLVCTDLYRFTEPEAPEVEDAEQTEEA